jgi:hypothetical protein
LDIETTSWQGSLPDCDHAVLDYFLVGKWITNGKNFDFDKVSAWKGLKSKLVIVFQNPEVLEGVSHSELTLQLSAPWDSDSYV